METIESLIRLLNSYPLWAKMCAIGGLLFSALILIFAPRNNTAVKAIDLAGSTVAALTDPRPIFLRIDGVKLFPDDPEAEIQVLAIVNGTTYEHPSVGGVKWMKVGPDMGPKIIELPKATVYQIRFEMRFRRGRILSSGQEMLLNAKPSMRAGSQRIDNIDALPFSEEYKLYSINENTREAAVRAVISYAITEGR